MAPLAMAKGTSRRAFFISPAALLLAYAERQREGRRAALDRMTEDASEAGLYGGTPEDYSAALKRARRRSSRKDDAS